MQLRPVQEYLDRQAVKLSQRYARRISGQGCHPFPRFAGIFSYVRDRPIAVLLQLPIRGMTNLYIDLEGSLM